MDISVIIVNYNTRELLVNCINSIKTNTFGVSYEIIIVDNGSDDGSQKMISDLFPWVRLIQTGQNLGFGKANNVGMKNALGKYFLLLNSDTIIKNNVLKIFFDYSETSSNIGALGSILYNENTKTCHSYGKFISPKTEIIDALSIYLRFLKDKSKFYPNEIKYPIEVDYITGADLFIPREIFKKIGGFDPSYFMYCEEVDWQKRMCDYGFRRLIIPGPKIIHLEGGSDKSKSSLWSVTRLHNFISSKKIYHKKHFSKMSYLVFRPFYWILYSLAFIILAFLKNKKYYDLIKSI